MIESTINEIKPIDPISLGLQKKTILDRLAVIKNALVTDGSLEKDFSNEEIIELNKLK